MKRERARAQGIPRPEHWRIVREREDGADPRPAEHFRELLTAARRNRKPFPQAWDESLPVITAEHGEAWGEAIADTKHAWRSSYVGYGRRLRLTPDLRDRVDVERPGVEILG